MTVQEPRKSQIPSRVPRGPPSAPPSGLADPAPRHTLKRKARDDDNNGNDDDEVGGRGDGAGTKASRTAENASAAIAARTKPEAKSTIRTTRAATGAAPRPVPAAGAKKEPAPTKPVTSKVSSSIPPPEKRTTKRPAWDTKGRLQDMEVEQQRTREELQKSSEAFLALTATLESSDSKIRELEDFRRNLEMNVEMKTRENNDIVRQLDDVKHQLESSRRNFEEELRSAETRHAREKNELQYTIDSMTRAHAGVESALRRAENEVENRDAEISGLKKSIATQSGALISLEAERQAVKISLEATESALRACQERVQELADLLEKERSTVVTLESKLREDEMMRRRLHNTILELKGNIRVFCRVRPPLPLEVGDESGAGAPLSHIAFPECPDDREIEIRQESESVSGQKIVTKTFPFSFDKVFQPSATQRDIFVDIEQLVQSALDGYNVCIFAYGQTGSGKTYTMEGAGGSEPELQGIIPRAIRQIYENVNQLVEKGWNYVMEGQFLEIYNEQINDLLGNGDFSGKHEIKHTSDSKTVVTDATLVTLDSPSKVEVILKKAAANRAVGATQCNERSSRSHSVFTLRLQGANGATEETSSGTLNLIDLAGSERLSASGSTGERLKETQAINKSLSSLGDVIYAISNGERHIPYRNSKLTYLLQNSLGGNSKTLMFVNISPLPANFQETLCSLRFATKVNSCEIGTAKRVGKAKKADDTA